VLLYRSVLNRRAGREELFDVAALMQLYPALQSSLLRNLALCISTCFVVLVLTIGSVRLAALATLTIGAIVGSLLGSLQLAGWSLACSEMVGGTIVVGFSFDYTLHLSCCYCASPMHAREARIADAVRHVGPTLFGAALTTSASLVLMSATDSSFLQDLSVMVIGALAWSLCYSLLLFVPLCALLGPEGPPTRPAAGGTMVPMTPLRGSGGYKVAPGTDDGTPLSADNDA